MYAVTFLVSSPYSAQASFFALRSSRPPPRLRYTTAPLWVLSPNEWI